MGLIDEHLRTDVAAGDGAPGSGKPGPATDMQASNLKVNAIGDLVTVGRLSPGNLDDTYASVEQGAKADAAVPNTPEGREALAGSPELLANYVVVRTADGHPLAPSTYVVITLDKTLAEITASPVADIADITFEEA
ncbi:hypothetical protein [Microbacterium sp.]|uniref:hypothetical protein n=1 Tax=Microbacterium sp. TaxID=51671 RepID=UPI0032427571